MIQRHLILPYTILSRNIPKLIDFLKGHNSATPKEQVGSVSMIIKKEKKKENQMQCNQKHDYLNIHLVSFALCNNVATTV